MIQIVCVVATCVGRTSKTKEGGSTALKRIDVATASHGQEGRRTLDGGKKLATQNAAPSERKGVTTPSRRGSTLISAHVRVVYATMPIVTKATCPRGPR